MILAQLLREAQIISTSVYTDNSQHNGDGTCFSAMWLDQCLLRGIFFNGLEQ